MTSENKRQNFNIPEQEAHFFNDVKYVTISLERERNEVLTQFKSEIFQFPVSEMRERFQRDYQEIFHSMKNELHNRMSQWQMKELLVKARELTVTIEKGHQLLVKLEKISEKLEEQYHLTFHSIGSLLDFLVLALDLDQEAKPTAAWFVEANYDAIMEMIDLAQTKVEDYKKSRKRLTKVWEEEILMEENLPLLEKFQSVRNGNLRILHRFYWKQKKQLRALFKEDLELLDEQEYEVLYHNLKIYHEGRKWLTKENHKVVSLLGDNYKKEETSFQQLRIEYDSIYRFLHKFSMELPMACVKELLKEDGIKELTCNIETTIGSNAKDQIALFCQIPVAEGVVRVGQSLSETMELMKRLDYNYQGFINDTERLLSIVYQTEKNITIGELNKKLLLVERIIKKERWLSEHQDKIESNFGGLYHRYATDWDAVREYLIQHSEESREESFGFIIYQEAIKPEGLIGNELSSELIDAVCEEVIVVEHPIKEELFQKKVGKLLEQKRITVRLKERMKEYLLTKLPSEFVFVDGVIQKEESKVLTMRIYSPEMGKRDIDTIPECELRAGLLRIIEAKKEITLEELSKTIAEVLHYPRRTKTLQTVVEEQVKKLKQKHKIVRHSGGWRLQ